MKRITSLMILQQLTKNRFGARGARISLIEQRTAVIQWSFYCIGLLTDQTLSEYKIVINFGEK